MSMSSPFIPSLEHLTRQRGVLGSLIVSETDGIVIDAVVQATVKAPVVAALAASLYRRARQSAHAAEPRGCEVLGAGRRWRPALYGRAR